MKDILKSYYKRLTNLSGNNKSLIQLRLYRDQDIDLRELDFVQGVSCFEVINALISGKKSVSICPVANSRDHNANAAAQLLRRISRRDRFIMQERGARDLYLAWPYVHGQFHDGTPVRCPLIYFPVKLVEKDSQWHLELRKHESISWNKSFLLAYAHFNQIKLEDELLESTLDDFDNDTQLFRSDMYKFLKESPLEIHFNQELFRDYITPFVRYKRSELQDKTAKGELKLFPEAVLGLFPQAGSYLVPDYEALIDNPPAESLETFFTGKSTDKTQKIQGLQSKYKYIREVKEELTFTPFQLDAFQENAIKACKSGASVVVQGPPGTGKSQLICNLVADYVARGKSVMVVSQKRAALDVVANRLKSRELHDFAATVHDFKADRKSIYEQIQSQIDRISEYQQRNNTLDAIFLEREFLKSSRIIDQVSEELEEFRHILYDEKESGWSAKELYLNSNPEGPKTDLKQYYNHFKRPVFDEFILYLQKILPYYYRIDEHHPWHDRVSFHQFSFEDKAHITETIQDVIGYHEQFQHSFHQILGRRVSLEESSWVLDREEVILSLINLLEEPEVFDVFQLILNKKIDQDWLLLKEDQIKELYTGLGIEYSLKREELGRFQQVLQKAINARKRIDKWVVWRLFNKDKYWIKRVLVANELNWNKKGFRQLMKKIDNRLNLEHNLTQLRQVDWVLPPEEGIGRQQTERWFHAHFVALEAKKISEELRSFRDFLRITVDSYNELKTKLETVLLLCHDADKKHKEWKEYLSNNQLQYLLNHPEDSEQYTAALDKDFENLCEYDAIKHKLRKIEWETVLRLVEKAESKDIQSTIHLFTNSIALHWLNHIEIKYPVLRAVSSLKMEQMEGDLRHHIKEKLRLSKDILLMKARELTYRYADYNRLNNMVTYRDIAHQVGKKRRIWPVRRLVKEFWDELRYLVPCWLVSPESASAVFPIDMKFDLVIFDEASQCFSEKGIPAMHRGRQVVIAGDSKQLRPNDLYQVRYDDEDEEEEHPELAVDSLLDLAANYLHQVDLQGHYRSRSLDLIEFSNHHFYKNRLRLLPDFHEMNTNTPGIIYDCVDGVWEKGANKTEAAQVIQHVFNLLAEGKESIGIVTFNSKQQNHIQDMLEQEALQKQTVLPEQVFVKNIENVQGDERDIIIFSVGYAPNVQGKMNMLFGSLNHEGGENRLNVAITRACHRIIVVTSIMPQQLQVDNSLHEGPKLFKAYLAYAHRVAAGDYKPRLFDEPGSKVPWLLKYRVQDIYDKENSSLTATETLPFADLTIKKGDEYRWLALTDDDLYHQSVSVKDFHAYLPMMLRTKNWHFRRYFSRHFWQDREDFTIRVQRIIREAEEGD